MGFAFDAQVVNFHVKGLLQLAHGASEGDMRLRRRNLLDGEALALQPFRNGRHIRVSGSEAPPKLRRRQPLVVVLRVDVVQLVHKRVQILLLFFGA